MRRLSFLLAFLIVVEGTALKTKQFPLLPSPLLPLQAAATIGTAQAIGTAAAINTANAVKTAVDISNAANAIGTANAVVATANTMRAIGAARARDMAQRIRGVQAMVAAQTALHNVGSQAFTDQMIAKVKAENTKMPNTMKELSTLDEAPIEVQENGTPDDQALIEMQKDIDRAIATPMQPINGIAYANDGT